MEDYFILLNSLLTKKEIEKKVKKLFSFFVNNEKENNYINNNNNNNKYNIYKDFENIFNFKYSLISSKEINDNTKFMYLLLRSYYQNEFYIKRKFVLSKFIDEEKDLIKFEYKLNNSRLDLLKIDKIRNISIAYEIKTAFDSFTRLKSQLLDYSTFFDYVYIITSLSHKNEFDSFLYENKVLNHVGVIFYDEKRKSTTFKKIKEANKSPLLNKKELINFFNDKELKIIFNSLNKEEIINSFDIDVINNLFKKSLINKYSLKSEELFKECKKLK